MPFQQHPAYANALQVVVHSNGDPTRLIPEVRRRIRRLAPMMATSFTTLSNMAQDSISVPRFRAALALSFAFFAVALAMAGVYSVMAFYVHERKAELGLRIALGADRASIVMLVFRRALSLAVAGLAAGVICAMASSHVVANLLYSVRALDFPTYCAGIGTVLIVTVLASFIPTWRASHVDPVEALRSE
jgi:ABC-type antimicrobial peptide transport system permease subunit